MQEMIKQRHYDVVVVGGGAAGVGAAIAASKNGAQTLLVESASYVGGELLSGLPIDGCLNARGEWIVGGVAKELFDGIKDFGGFVEPVFDWRLMWGVCLEPDVMKLVVVKTLARYKVELLLYTLAESIVSDGKRVTGVIVVNKGGKSLITADWIIDCTGDGSMAIMAGADYEKGGPNGTFQPVTWVFRMGNLNVKGYLEFIRDNPDQFLLGESPVAKKSKAECAMEIYKTGYPFAGLSAESSLLRSAIDTGEMYPCTAVYVVPNSMVRGEVSINSTRIADIDATDPEVLSRSMFDLTDQVEKCVRFLNKKVPGFEKAQLVSVAPRLGIRETNRVMGEYVLTEQDVLNGRKFGDGIAKGGHHVDIHGSGTYQKRTPVKEGNSYDIPYGCLVPRNLKNVWVAGRCFSSSREANGSARNMGQCLSTGEAAGTAAGLCVEHVYSDSRNVPIEKLRSTLKAQGAILDGTH